MCGPRNCGSGGLFLHALRFFPIAYGLFLAVNIGCHQSLATHPMLLVSFTLGSHAAHVVNFNWRPSFQTFDHLHPEYEVFDYKDGYRYIDFTYILPYVRLAIENNQPRRTWCNPGPCQYPFLYPFLYPCHSQATVTYKLFFNIVNTSSLWSVLKLPMGRNRTACSAILSNCLSSIS